MSQTQSLLAELERAVSQGSERTRRAALNYTTDLLMAGRYTEEETWVFGEVVGLLAAEIETGARAELAQRLAVLPHMPSNIVCKLASDDAIEVAGPVLRHSERLGVSDLVANAKSKSQAHLLAISQRKSLHEDVTDVLVVAGRPRRRSFGGEKSGCEILRLGVLAPGPAQRRRHRPDAGGWRTPGHTPASFPEAHLESLG